MIAAPVKEFTYISDASVPVVAKPSTTNYAAGSTVSLTGTNLSGALIYIDDTQVIASVTSTATSISFPFPALPAGTYKLRVNKPIGDAVLGDLTTQWDGKLTTTFSASTVTPATGSSAGAIVTITVNGLDLDPLNKPSAKFNAGECAIISWTSSQIKCRTPKISAADTVSVTRIANVPFGQREKVNGGSYTGSATGAPTVTAATATTSGATTTFSLTGTGLSGTATPYLQLVSNPNVAYEGTVTSNTATTAVFTVANLPAGIYIIRVNIDAKGFAVFSSATIETYTVALTVSTTLENSFLPASIAGGQSLTITGSGFSAEKEENTISVCGLPCSVTTSTSSSVECSLPRLLTRKTQQTYNFPDVDLRVEAVAQISDVTSNVDPTLLSDGATDSHYSSGAANCFIGLDFGNQLVAVSKINFYPRSLGVTSAFPHVGGEFQGSVDGSNWANIYTLPSAFLG